MTVGVIFLVYMVCNIPASVVLLLDPDATKYIEVNNSAVFCSYHVILQAHLPCYILAWLSSVIKPFVYVGCSPAYRLAFTEAFTRLSCSGFIIQPVQRLLNSYSVENDPNRSEK